jgi:hypothetical protein
MPNSNSSNNTAWLAWSAYHAVFGSSFVSVEFFKSENSAAEESETSARRDAAPEPQLSDSGHTGRDFL